MQSGIRRVGHFKFSNLQIGSRLYLPYKSVQHIQTKYNLDDIFGLNKCRNHERISPLEWRPSLRARMLLNPEFQFLISDSGAFLSFKSVYYFSCLYFQFFFFSVPFLVCQLWTCFAFYLETFRLIQVQYAFLFFFFYSKIMRLNLRESKEEKLANIFFLLLKNFLF